MTYQSRNYSQKSENKALVRSKPNVKTPAVAFSDEQLSQSVWGKIALFLNNYYQRFTPKPSQDYYEQGKIATIEKEAIKNLWSNNLDLTWDDLIKKHDYKVQKTVDKFYFHLSRKFQDSPLKFKENWEHNLQTFVQLLEYVLGQNNLEDLLKVSELGDIFDQFQGSSSRTFFVLEQLPLYLENEAQKMITSSLGYQKIMSVGSSRFLENFALQLQKHFQITRTAIKEQVAQNLVQHLGETETALRNQVEFLQQDNERLKDEIENVKTTALEEATFVLGKTLQNQSQPVLTQILVLKQRLEQTLAADQPLSNTDALTCVITLEDIVKALQNLNLTPFPSNLNTTFTIRGEQLGEYNYVSGSPFANNQDIKQVRCIRQGWRVGEQIITPAQVEEIKS